MKAVSVIAIAVTLIALVAGIGSAYAYYNSTLTDNETVTAINNYGTVTLTEQDGVYTLSYDDTTSDSVYLTMDISGLSPDYAAGTILDLWIGKENVTAGFGSSYNATVVGNELKALSKPLDASGSTYTDGNRTYNVTCSDDVVTVTKNGTPISVAFGNFRDGTDYYIVDASGDTVNSVKRIIPINGSNGEYAFDDDGYTYAVTCSGSAVTKAVRAVVVSSMVDAQGNASFGTWTKGLTLKHWQDTIDLYCVGTAADIGSYDIEARFYSAEVTP